MDVVKDKSQTQSIQIHIWEHKQDKMPKNNAWVPKKYEANFNSKL